jgi:hypothetical protein
MTAGQMHESIVRDSRGRFAVGHSANPAGPVKSKRYVALLAGIVSEFGELTPAESVVVDQAIRLLIRAERAADHALAARCSRTAQSWLRDLRERRAVQAPLPQTVEEMLNG